MKKLILALLFLLLSCPVFAETQLAWMGPVIAGCGTGTVASCTTSNDSKLWNPATQPGTNESSQGYLAVKFTVATDKTITAYRIRECDDSGADTGNGIVRIITHDSGNDWPTLSGSTPVAVANSSSNTFAASILADCTTHQVDEYTVSSPFTLSAGTYWLILEVQNSANIAGLYASSTGDRVCYKSLAETSWNCINDYMYDMELWGCD